jgi:hypothetical protein
MKIKILLAALALLVILIPAIGSAGTTVETYKTNGAIKIDADIAWFNKEKAYIDGKGRLTTERKTFLKNIADKDIAVLQQMKDDLNKATDLKSAKQDYKSINYVYSGLKNGLKDAVSQ